jgi:TetR/AcrR family transcriptional regulator of autoinduction and epiphytic fitness
MKNNLKVQQLRLKEELILSAVNGLLAQKGYDLMTMDDVASAVGVGKPSLYKLFSSKEQLAAAAMARLLERALGVIQAQPALAAPLEKLKAVLRWALEQHLQGAMPLLPATRSTLREALLKHEPYVQRLGEVAAALSDWIEAAQKDGALGPAPTEVVLYILFARTCDPVLEYLQSSGAFTDAQIVDTLLAATFDGLRRR